jgi:MoaA/NifB/PqqE/SkfB family radical SAM enzyme
MECKFLSNGLSISYDHIIKPCCVWPISDSWANNNNIRSTSLVNWHQTVDVQKELLTLKNQQWPASCNSCKKHELSSRGDSMRLNGNRAYADYNHEDITLEIRPGSVCNFACQTCWPAASSRVAQYHHRAKLVDIKNINSSAIENFDFLLPVADKIKNVVLLGGEPFYDKNCKKFLYWAIEHLHADLLLFTNGSSVDFDFLTSYQKEITLVFSIDAIGSAAEYIRFGTVWSEVLDNYNRARQLKNVKVRVNITCSVYNYIYLNELLQYLCNDWPSVVTFGVPHQGYFLEDVIPPKLRQPIIEQLVLANNTIWNSKIEIDQQHNASNALMSIVNNLKEKEWDINRYQQLCNFITKMDQVKNVKVGDYSGFLQSLIEYQFN